jgi:hypothetical protein
MGATGGLDRDVGEAVTRAIYAVRFRQAGLNKAAGQQAQLGKAALGRFAERATVQALARSA